MSCRLSSRGFAIVTYLPRGPSKQSCLAKNAALLARYEDLFAVPKNKAEACATEAACLFHVAKVDERSPVARKKAELSSLLSQSVRERGTRAVPLVKWKRVYFPQASRRAMSAILTTQPLSFASIRSTKSLSRNTAGSSFASGRDDPSAGSVTDGPLKLIELSLCIRIFEAIGRTPDSGIRDR